jgi:hypothetical protein
VVDILDRVDLIESPRINQPGKRCFFFFKTLLLLLCADVVDLIDPVNEVNSSEWHLLLVAIVELLSVSLMLLLFVDVVVVCCERDGDDCCE